MKEVNEMNLVARCDKCLFGRIVTVIESSNGGKSKDKREMCECHVARPTRSGFPVVRLDDFCACHVNAATLERTFANLTQEGK